ncbi:uncharacterized protein LOC118800192 isoform X2 [Colossoma macropomum]|uniref:uncharacterized protein LOC118800192 isoform X2 n=1 Tax=Colossoma macropomum TaxID=42526 RepID=UPI001865098F|nr:uncharacterized protein LOC118800192 isoform X2 [Colossoma macropomum]
MRRNRGVGGISRSKRRTSRDGNSSLLTPLSPYKKPLIWPYMHVYECRRGIYFKCMYICALHIYLQLTSFDELTNHLREQQLQHLHLCMKSSNFMMDACYCSGERFCSRKMKRAASSEPSCGPTKRLETQRLLHPVLFNLNNADFSSGGYSSWTETQRPLSPEPFWNRFDVNGELDFPDELKEYREALPEPSHVPLYSNSSVIRPPDLSAGGTGTVLRLQKSRAESPESSLVSMRSSNSMFRPPDLSTGGTWIDPRLQISRAESPEPSCVSMKSNNSMFRPPDLSTGGTGIDPRLQKYRAESPESSLVSMRSSNSMFRPPDLSTGGTWIDPRLQICRAESPEPSCVSMKSNNSMFRPPDLSTGGTGIDPRLQKSRAESPESSLVSMRSSNSMFRPPDLSTGGTWIDPRLQISRAESPEPSCVSMKSNNSMFRPPDLSTGGTGIDPSWAETQRPLSPEPFCNRFDVNGELDFPDELKEYIAALPEPSHVPLYSNSSVIRPPDLSAGGTGTVLRLQKSRAESPESSLVSMRSSNSMFRPPDLSTGGTGIDPRLQICRAESPEPSCVSMKSNNSMFRPPDLSTGGTGIDPRLQNYRAESPESSLVSMRSSNSMFRPPDLSTGGTGIDPRLQISRAESPEPSCVSMKSNNSMFRPPDLSTGGTGIDPRLPMFGAEFPEPSCVSMKSSDSMFNPPDLRAGGVVIHPRPPGPHWRAGFCPPTFQSARGAVIHPRHWQSRADYPEPSCVSMRSSNSMFNPPDLSAGGVVIHPRHWQSRADYPEPSCVSMRSSNSMFNPPDLRAGGAVIHPRHWQSRADYPEPSCVSMRSSNSMFNPPDLSAGGVVIHPRHWQSRADYPEPSYASMRSSNSMFNPPDLRAGGAVIHPSSSSISRGQLCVKSSNFQMDHSKSKSKRRRRIRNRSRVQPCVESSNVVMDSSNSWCRRPSKKNWRRAGPGDVLHRVIVRHKSSMKNRHESLFEGIKTQENETLLNRIYTQLYIVEGDSKRVNEEHEVSQIEKTYRKHKDQKSQDTTINYLDIFKPVEDPKREMEEQNIRYVMANTEREEERKEDEDPKKLRTVLTKGIAGIGKTVTVQKFILDWAEGKNNQDIDFMFVLQFRELNLIKDDQFSLHRLLCDFHPELKDLDPKIYDSYKVVLIFDGLDESRIPLSFSQCEKISDITMTSSVGMLMTNLIKGDLLPSARIWITSRPAAANQIPPEYIDRVTEIQGFNDPQKEEYFRKRISDEDKAKRIISHIKTVKSLHIMCHIPVFCWISATVLQQMINQSNTEMPKTLTEMYIHFLLTQTNMKNEKYEGKNESDPVKLLEFNREMILKLAKLAFKQLMKGNVMFYEEDLRECGIDVTEASVNSGICTEIFKEESVIYQRKVYCFVHLSFQEFLAAFHLFYCYVSKNMEEVQFFLQYDRAGSDSGTEEDCQPDYDDAGSYSGTMEDYQFDSDNASSDSDIYEDYACFSSDFPYALRHQNSSLIELLTRAVHKALNSDNGHLDLFLRFLLGISLESNQKLLQGLLMHTESSSESISETVQHIKHLIQTQDLPTERSINLFLCLTEVNDQSLSREIQEYLKSQKHAETELSAAQCSAIAYMLQTSDEVLDELDPKKFNTSEEGHRRLVPAVSNCRKALLTGCNLEKSHCETVCSALTSANSSLQELDLSNNNLQDSVELLSVGLRSSNCKLQILRLSGCSLGEKACENLKSVLRTENSSLKELDLSNNDLQDSGVEKLCAGLKSSHCKLQILRLSGCMITEVGCCSLASALSSNPSHLNELDLTYNHPGKDSPGVKQLSFRLEDPQCALKTLRVEHGGENRIEPGLKKYAYELTLDPNTADTCVVLSDGNRVKHTKDYDNGYPNHPDRFDQWEQVLSKESLTGRCYWEAEWSGKEAAVAVAYKSMERKGRYGHSKFGYNNKSWSLLFDKGRYVALHNNKTTTISTRPSRSKIMGVYVDCPAGILSFYDVSDTLTHLHTFYTTFTEPLYAGLRAYDSTIRICNIE